MISADRFAPYLALPFRSGGTAVRILTNGCALCPIVVILQVMPDEGFLKMIAGRSGLFPLAVILVAMVSFAIARRQNMSPIDIAFATVITTGVVVLAHCLMTPWVLGRPLADLDTPFVLPYVTATLVGSSLVMLTGLLGADRFTAMEGLLRHIREHLDPAVSAGRSRAERLRHAALLKQNVRLLLAALTAPAAADFAWRDTDARHRLMAWLTTMDGLLESDIADARDNHRIIPPGGPSVLEAITEFWRL